MGWGGLRRARWVLVPMVGAVVAAGAALAPDGGPTVTAQAADPVSVLEGSTVLVRAGTCTSWRLGSGVVVDGIVLTNAHVVEGATAVSVQGEDGTWRTVDRVRRAPGLDLAALDAAGVGRGVEVASVAPGPGDAVWTSGHPGGGRLRTAGAAVAQRREREVWTDPPVAVELTATARPGQSGSPVVDATGRLVGLVYAAAFDGGGALAIDTPQLREALADRGTWSGADDGLVECPGAAGN